MARWRVRRKDEKEVIEADHLQLEDGHLVFSDNKYVIDAIRIPGEWFAVDRIEDKEEATVELATSVELTEAGWYVSHAEVAQPELA